MDKETEVGLKNLIGIEGMARLNALARLTADYKDKPDFLASRLIYKGIEEIEKSINQTLERPKELE